MSRCVIISACPVSASLASALRPGDTIIACDAGYRNCGPLHCRPDIIVGDFDTAPCPAQEGDDTIILPHVKDDTDTEYAAKLASEKGFDEALLLGVLGGRRLEHTLANLCTGLGLEQRGVRATLLDERSRITFVMPGETRRYPKDGYFYPSTPSSPQATPSASATSMPMAPTASPSPPKRARWWWWRRCRTGRS